VPLLKFPNDDKTRGERKNMTNFNSAASRERIKRAQHFARRSLKKHESILRSSRGRFNHPISVPSTPEYSGFPYGNHQSRNRFGNTQGAQRHNTRRRCDTRRVIRQQTFAFPIRFRVRSRGRWRLLALPPPPSPRWAIEPTWQPANLHAPISSPTS